MLFPDADKLHDSYAEWLKFAEESARRLASTGMIVEPFVIDIDDFLGWCVIHGHPRDAKARTEYVTEKLSHKYPSKRESQKVIIGAGSADWFQHPLPPNRTGDFPASSGGSFLLCQAVTEPFRRMSHISTVGVPIDHLVNARPVIRQSSRSELARPTARLSQSQYSAGCITFISMRHDGLYFCALQASNLPFEDRRHARTLRIDFLTVRRHSVWRLVGTGGRKRRMGDGRQHFVSWAASLTAALIGARKIF
jgi:hypothetical protein